MKAKLLELVEEFRAVFAGRGYLADTVIPPSVFLIVNPLLGFAYAALASLLVALLVCLFRFGRGQSLKYALGGLGGAILAVLAARLLNSAAAYFLPGVLSGSLTVVACAVSAVVGRPLVAWTSHVVRRWPLGWYWHPRVRPAYTEVTIAWAVFYAARLAAQFLLFKQAQTGALAIVNVLAGWPATVVLLALSYVYGLWRLGQLRGPSVAEFEQGVAPPWAGQRRGF